MSDAKNSVHKEILPNGLVVITEPMEHVHSVSVGIWLRAGSRREPAALNGISHFIEHMVFKGTRPADCGRYRAGSGQRRRDARCVHVEGNGLLQYARP